jgi:hypothetical protein
VALRAKVVDLVRTHLGEDARQVGTVGEVAIVQHEALVLDVRVFVDVVDALGVEQGRAALDAVDLVAFRQQELGQVAAVLAGDACDECAFGHGVVGSM